jgi:hypothetical protein
VDKIEHKRGRLPSKLQRRVLKQPGMSLPDVGAQVTWAIVLLVILIRARLRWEFGWNLFGG